MKFHFFSKKVATSLLAVLLLLILFSTSCGTSPEGFAIYLADSGEMLLSENDITDYDSDNNILELNENGINKWNSHIRYAGTPKLADTLFQRDFVLKIEGQEICRGKFWSNLSSGMYPGVVILDAWSKLEKSNNILWIQSSYPGSRGVLDPAIVLKLEDFFKKHNLLK